jgi:hypothetical protein
VINRYSSFNKLLRLVAYVSRFIRHAKASRENRQSGDLTTLEIDSAMTTVIKQVQVEGFAQELKELSRGNQVSKRSKLLALSPFLDKGGVIRMGGRTQKASIANDQKHKILLPYNHVTDLTARQEHVTQLHAAPPALLYAIRQRFWPIMERKLVRKIVRLCSVCFRTKPKECSYLMVELPADRVQQH